MDKIPALLRSGHGNIFENPPASFMEIAGGSCYGGMTFISNLVSSLSKEMPSYSEELHRKKDSILRAFEDYKKFLSEDLSRRATGNYATGKELFDELLYEDYMLDYGSEEVLEAGWEIFRNYSERTGKTGPSY